MQPCHRSFGVFGIAKIENQGLSQVAILDNDASRAVRVHDVSLGKGLLGSIRGCWLIGHLQNAPLALGMVRSKVNGPVVGSDVAIYGV